MPSPLRVNYIEKGSGSPVVLIHGVAGSLEQWNHLVPVLAENGYRAFALDLLGHGESARPENGQRYDLEAIYAHFEDWMDSLPFSTPPVLIGHSMGGYLSLRYTLRNPGKARALALVNPFYSTDQLSRMIRLTLKRPAWTASVLKAAPQWTISTALVLGHRNGDSLDREARRSIARDYKRTHPQVFATAQTAADLTPALGRVSAPTMLFWGEKDQTLRPESFPALQQALPQAEGVSFPGCGHVPHLAQRERFNKEILRYLEKLTW